MKRTAIIMVNFNGWHDTLECLQSFSFPLQHACLFFVDNGSTDDSISQLKDYLQSRKIYFVESDLCDGVDPSVEVVIIQNDLNLGFAAANNQVLRYLLRDGGFEYAWLLNNDTLILKDSLPNLIRDAEACTDHSFFGSVLLDHRKPEQVQSCGVRHYAWTGVSSLQHKNQKWESLSELKIQKRQGIHYQVGASLLVRLRHLKHIGLMDERFFMYSEDADWMIRAQGMGYQNRVSVGSRVLHKGSSSTSGNKKFFFFHYNRSAVLLTRKNFGFAAAIAATISLILLTMIRSRMKPGCILCGVKGILEGWKMRLGSNMFRKQKLFGFDFWDAEDEEQVAEMILNDDRIFNRQQAAFLVTPNAYDMALYHFRYRDLLKVFRNSAVVLADGMPLVWLSRLKGKPLKRRITGANLFPILWEKLRQKNKRAFFILPSAEMGEVFQLEYAGCRHASPSFFDAADDVYIRSFVEKLMPQIIDHKPDFIFIGLTIPKQQKMAFCLQKRLTENAGFNCTIALLGSAYEYHLGYKRKAPRVFQRTGTEWLFRLVQEPARLWKRYTWGNLLFLVVAAMELSGLNRIRNKAEEL